MQNASCFVDFCLGLTSSLPASFGESNTVQGKVVVRFFLQSPPVVCHCLRISPKQTKQQTTLSQPILNDSFVKSNSPVEIDQGFLIASEHLVGSTPVGIGPSIFRV